MTAYLAQAQAMVNLELRACGLAATAELLHDGAQLVTMLVRTSFGVDPAKVKRLADALALRVGAEGCTIHQRGIGLLVTLPKAPEHRRALRPAEVDAAAIRERRRMPCSAAPLGLGIDGRVVWLDLADPRSPHAIVLGLTGSGKSSLLQWIAYRLCQQNCAEHLGLIVISPKASDYELLAGVPHLLHPPVASTVEARQVLGWLEGEIDRRNAEKIARPAIVALVDEVPALVDADPAIGDGLDQIARIGRSLGIHLLAGSQRADQRTIGGLVFNMPVRLIGRLGSSAFNWITSGKSGSAADELIGNGDMLLAGPAGLVRLQAPLLAARDWGRLERGYSRCLDLPELVQVTPTATAANAQALGDDALLEIAEAYRQGASIRQVMSDYRIGYERAKRLQALSMLEVTS